jgi:hypothetical protein
VQIATERANKKYFPYTDNIAFRLTNMCMWISPINPFVVANKLGFREQVAYFRTSPLVCKQHQIVMNIVLYSKQHHMAVTMANQITFYNQYLTRSINITLMYILLFSNT